MARKLIVCCDGTWNQPESHEDGAACYPTNVLKFARALEAVNRDDSQIIYYDSGIGTANGIDRIVGGMFGIGLSRNVLDAYRFLAMNFHPGDEIFLFGFSRGAYTVRSLSGLISLIGLLPKTDIHWLPTAYRYYRTAPAQRSKARFTRLEQLLADNDEAFRRPRIRMIGVWDSVGALGAPTPLLQKLSRRLIGFHDTALANNIDYAYQALALDEKRGPFKPDLWTQSGQAQEIKQVWFPGVHSDIGGGYAPTNSTTEAGARTVISDNALDWMISLARRHGLEFDHDYLTQQVNVSPNAPLHDSYSLLYRILEKFGARSFRRKINEPVYGTTGTELPVNEYLHPTLVDRWDAGDMHYDPVNLTARVMANVPIWQIPYQPEVTDASDRRRSNRILLEDVHALFAVAGQEHRCVLLDIAKHEGIRIRSEADVPVGAQIDFNSSLTGPLQGRVVWRDGQQAGVKLAA
jgi:Uncharacterized alpha/beta hydrolase domain (DUF2235)